MDKLFKAEFVRSVDYSTWLSNVVLIKKVNEQWQVYVDFIYLNRACPKYCFPLPQIDELVDDIIGYRLLSFMDIYSSYSQIKMHQLNQEHTSFIID